MKKYFLSVLPVFFAISAFANIAEPPRPSPGQLIGEPLLNKHFVVNSEELVLDMRNADRSKLAHVVANYDFSSDTAVEYLSLVFVANNLKGNNYHIKLDNQLVKGDTISIDSVPSQWNAPKELKWDDQIVFLQHNYYNNEFDNSYILFTIPVSLGNHSLSVEYDAEMPRFYTTNVVTSSLVYMLSPAKDWKAYHELNLKIALPQDWIWRSNLDLKKEGKWLHGHWNKLPADYVYIATRVDDTFSDFYQYLYLYGLWGLLVLIIFWRLFVITRKYKAGKETSGYTWTVVLWMMVVGVVVFYIIFFNLGNIMELIYGDQLHEGFGYGDFYAIMAAPFLWAFSVAAGYVFQAIVTLFPIKTTPNQKS